MAIVGGLFGILTYLLVIGVIGGILYFVVKAAVKEGMLEALEEWHKEHEGDGSFRRTIKIHQPCWMNFPPSYLFLLIRLPPSLLCLLQGGWQFLFPLLFQFKYVSPSGHG